MDGLGNLETDEFLKAQKRKSKPEKKGGEKKHPCDCEGKGGITVLDILMAALAAYGSFKLGMDLKAFVMGYFQKPLPLES
jgi:hypothetical protein